VSVWKGFAYLFRKYPLFRVIFYALVLGVGILVSVTVSFRDRVMPVIVSISPSIGSTGEILTIRGSGFGESRENGAVTIGGSSITASRYLSWSDTEIRLMLPPNVGDGLVAVETGVGKSEPKIFANAANIPVALRSDMVTTLPVINSVSVGNQAAWPGQLLTITGANFGSARGESLVLFTPAYSKSIEIPVDYIPASAADFDYEYWSDSEIKVRLPDGAAAGPLYVKTVNGDSNTQRITLSNPVGTKQFGEGRVFVLHFNVDVSNAVVSESASLILRIPRPQRSAVQPRVEVQECIPEPVIADFNGMIIQQIQLDGLQGGKAFFTHSFVVPVYSVSTDIDAARVTAYTEKDRLLYQVETAPDDLIHSDNPEILALAQSVVKSERNPYRQARLLYDYLLDTYTLLQETRPGESDPYDILATRGGDSYDFAVLFCALARTLGIPALPVAGVLVDSERQARNHWWCELYIERFGWIPVDPGLGAGLAFVPFGKAPDDPRSFYFGNMDAHHIAFSRGWKVVKPAIPNSKTVYHPRAYAFQSIWEESSAGTEQYSSFWSEPLVAGIY
jgi:hypothetical protein